jgi:hypothetical protein
VLFNAVVRPVSAVAYRLVAVDRPTLTMPVTPNPAAHSRGLVGPFENTPTVMIPAVAATGPPDNAIVFGPVDCQLVCWSAVVPNSDPPWLILKPLRRSTVPNGYAWFAKVVSSARRPCWPSKRRAAQTIGRLAIERIAQRLVARC